MREKIRSVDVAWLRMENPTNLMMITGILLLEQPLDWSKFRLVLESRLLAKYPRFQQKLYGRQKWITTPYWETDPDFLLDNHLERIALPVGSGHEALEQLVTKSISTPLDLDRPMWFIQVVDNYENGSALIIRIHHVIADGIALLQVLLSLTDESELKKDDQTVSPERRTVSPYHLTSFQDYAKHVYKSVGSLSKLLFCRPDPMTPIKGELGLAKRASWSRPIPLALIKSIKTTTDATINDIMMTVITGALRRYLVDDADTPAQEFRAAVPINLRPLEAPPTLGNRFGLVFLTLPIEIVSPLARLTEMKKRMNQLKHSPEAIVAYGLLSLIGVAPPVLARAAMRLFGSKTTVVITNVRGPEKELSFAHSPLKGAMFWVPQSGGLGIGISILSFNDEVLIGVATDVRLLPAPALLVRYFEEELMLLLDELNLSPN